MESLIINGKEDTPEFNFNSSSGILQIVGNSYPDDPFEIFTPAIKWVDEYIKTPLDLTTIEIKLNYLNTASSKQITEFLKKFENVPSGKKALIKWYFDKMDEDMEFEAKTLESIVKVQFELVTL